MTWSDGVYPLVGLPRGDAQPSLALFLSRLHPDDREIAEREAFRLATSGNALDTEFRVLRPGGNVRWVAFQGEVFCDAEGCPSWSAGTLIDITRIRRAQHDVDMREERSRALAGMTAVGVWRATGDGSLVDMPFLDAFTGRSQRDQGRIGWLLFIHPDDVAGVASTWQEAVRIGSATAFSCRARHRSGTYRWLRMKAEPLRNPDGSVREWVGTVEDVQGEREAEDSRRFREASLRLAGEHAHIAIWDYDLESGRRADPKGAEGALGMTSPVVEDMRDRIHPEDSLRVLGAIQRTRIDGERCDETFRVLDPDGRTRWLQVCAKPLRNALVETGHVIGLTRDVTAAQEAEMRARTAQSAAALLQTRIAALASLTGVVTWTANVAGEMTEMPGWMGLTGQPEDEARGWGWCSMLHPLDRERVRQALQMQAEARQGANLEFRVRNAEGEYHWLRSRSAPVVGAGGAVLEWVGVCNLATPPSPGAGPEATDTDPAAFAPEALQLVTGAQVRAARGLLRWGVRELAEAARVSGSTIRRVEADDGVPSSRDARILQALRTALVEGGVDIFVGPNGSGAVSPGSSE